MGNVFKNFYTDLYNRTNGFIPTKPLNQDYYPGDFFQIHNGEIVVLGNIFQNNIIAPENTQFSYGSKLNPTGWNFAKGVTKPYSGRDSGQDAVEGSFRFSRQLLAFDGFGSFLFRADAPETVKIANWNSIEQSLIIKLTQTIYSFRELYVVTESALPTSWTLAVAGSEKAELEIATEKESFGLVDFFGDQEAKTIQTRGIEYYHREAKRRPSFFKAKRLAVQQEKLEVFISDLISRRRAKSVWVQDFYEYDFYEPSSLNLSISHTAQACVLDMLQANELNPNTALLYFKWDDANLDDVEKLFTYG